MVRSFHAWLDEVEPLKFLLAALVLPLMLTTVAHGPASLRGPCGVLVALFLATRAWCVYVPGR